MGFLRSAVVVSAIVAVVLLVRSEYPGAAISFGLSIAFWIAAGGLKPQEPAPPKSKRIKVRPPKPVLETIASVVTSRTDSKIERDLRGVGARLDPKWSDWLHKEWRDSKKP